MSTRSKDLIAPALFVLMCVASLVVVCDEACSTALRLAGERGTISAVQNMQLISLVLFQ